MLRPWTVYSQNSFSIKDLIVYRLLLRWCLPPRDRTEDEMTWCWCWDKSCPSRAKRYRHCTCQPPHSGRRTGTSRTGTVLAVTDTCRSCWPSTDTGTRALQTPDITLISRRYDYSRRGLKCYYIRSQVCPFWYAVTFILCFTCC